MVASWPSLRSAAIVSAAKLPTVKQFSWSVKARLQPRMHPEQRLQVERLDGLGGNEFKVSANLQLP